MNYKRIVTIVFLYALIIERLSGWLNQYFEYIAFVRQAILNHDHDNRV